MALIFSKHVFRNTNGQQKYEKTFNITSTQGNENQNQSDINSPCQLKPKTQKLTKAGKNVGKVEYLYTVRGTVN